MKKVESGESVTRPFANFDQIESSNLRELPKAYAITSHQQQFRKLLDAHHIPYEVVKQEEQHKAGVQRVASLTVNKEYRKGIRDYMEDMKVEREIEDITLVPGDLIVPTNGALGVLAGLILEPESSNSIYQEGEFWGLLLSHPFPFKQILN